MIQIALLGQIKKLGLKHIAPRHFLFHESSLTKAILGKKSLAKAFSELSWKSYSKKLYLSRGYQASISFCFFPPRKPYFYPIRSPNFPAFKSATFFQSMEDNAKLGNSVDLSLELIYSFRSSSILKPKNIHSACTSIAFIP